MVDRIHVIDPDIRRRAQLARKLSDWKIHTEIYEDIEEFRRRRPSEGFVFAADEKTPDHSLELVEVLRMGGSSLPVVIYAQEPELESVLSAMRAGALDYLRWPFDDCRLGTAFRRLDLEGSRLRQEEQLRGRARAKVNDLTLREREVLILVIQGRSNKEAARELGISPRTVEIHRGHMMTKLAAQSAADAVRIGLYAGLDERFRFAA